MTDKKKILIVEDDSALRQAISDKLSREGYQVVEASDGQMGFDLAIKEKPDLILLDILMPKLHGIQVVEKLREDSWGRTAQIIIMTNLAEDNKVAKAMKMGVTDYLIKGDWRLEDVLIKVKEKLDKKT
ncbi:response regulator transcription factor [Patescibacteria group bacterium]|nr:response regulator transcription factor [Patescibacteria group bacterium]